MRRTTAVSKCPGAGHNPSRLALLRTVKGGLLVFLAGALVALAGTPANLQEALQAQRALVAENPGDADLLNDLGNLLALAGDLEDAEEVYGRALEVDPGDVTTLYNLALVLREQDENKRAMKTFKTILESDPRHAWTHYQLGTLYTEQKNRSKAVHHYAKAFSIDRSLTSPKVNPHIVENRLATDALLVMHVDDSPSTQAPRIYEEPGDVADLLLPPSAEPPVTETAPEEPGADSTSTSSRHRVSYSQPSESSGESEDSTGEPVPDDKSHQKMGMAGVKMPDEEPSTPSSDPAEPRKIDASTLRTQRYQQPVSQGAKGQDLGGSTSGTTATEQTGLGRTQFGGVASAPPASPSPPTGSSSGIGGDTTASPGGFTPGVQSTGRLDIELLPIVETAPVTSST